MAKNKLTTPIPQDKIGESFVWRDWFQRLSDKVFGSMASQDANSVAITGGSISGGNINNVAITNSTVSNSIIEGTPIGLNNPAAGAFTSLYAATLAVDTGTDGQVLIGRTSDHHFVPALLTAGSNVTITTGPSSVTISSSPIPGVAGPAIYLEAPEAEEVLVFPGPTGPKGDVGATGTGGALGYYGAYHDTSTVTATSAAVAYVMNIGSTDLQNGINIVGGTKITATNAGIYNLQFSAQFTNPNAAIADISIWIRINGVNVADGAGTNGIPAKHGANNGLQIVSWNYVISLNAGDYVELVWHSDITGVQLITIPATIGPAVPESPSVIVTIAQIMYTQIGPIGPQGFDGEQGEEGPLGPPGLRGLTGTQGPTGPAVYLEADSGDQGDMGPQGVIGLTGQTGLTGPQGPLGAAIFLDADAGEQGDIGPVGQTGLQGSTGIQGVSGAVGPAVYLDADTGEQGDMGPQGPQGLVGATGSTGSQGVQGVTGPAVYLEAQEADEPIFIGGPTVPINISLAWSAPVTKTADFTLLASDVFVINNKAAATCTVTLPLASTFPGRPITFQNYQAFTLVSATSNVVPPGGGAAGTAILAASIGDWAKLISDGTNWINIESAPNNSLLLE